MIPLFCVVFESCIVRFKSRVGGTLTQTFFYRSVEFVCLCILEVQLLLGLVSCVFFCMCMCVFYCLSTKKIVSDSKFSSFFF